MKRKSKKRKEKKAMIHEVKKKKDLSSQKRETVENKSYHRVMCMWSLFPKDLLQFGHLRDREVRRSSTQSLQKT